MSKPIFARDEARSDRPEREPPEPSVPETKTPRARRLDPSGDVSPDADPNTPVPRLPLLITGLAGVAGHAAFDFFSRLYPGRVVGVRRPDLWTLRGDGIVGCDLGDPAAVNDLWSRYQFGAVINAIGSCRLKSCELDPAMAERVNFRTTENVARAAARHDARMLHLSIDLVFAGRDGGGYRETDRPDPVTVYGKVMASAETCVEQQVADSAILRISLPMGPSFNGHAGAIDWIESRFIAGKPATLYFDEVRTPAYTEQLNRLFARVLSSDLRGVYHAGGSRAMSLFEIAQVVNVVGGYPPELLMGCPRAEAGPMPPRAGNVAMDSAKLEAALGRTDGLQLGLRWPQDDSLVPAHRDWHRTERDQIPFFGSETEQCSAGRDAVNRLLYSPGELAPGNEQHVICPGRLPPGET